MMRNYTREDVEAAIFHYRDRGLDPLFDNVNLAGVDLSDLDLHDSRFICANLAGANLAGANLSTTYWCKTNVAGACFRNAKVGVSILNAAGLTAEDLCDALRSPWFLDCFNVNNAASHSHALHVANMLQLYHVFVAKFPTLQSQMT